MRAGARAGGEGPARPYAGLEQRPIKALAPERVADLLAGRGATYALAAKLSSYPGPRHVLDRAADLALTPEQRRAAEEAYAAMEAEAKQLGRQLVEREAALDRAFAGGAPTADEVAQLAGEAAATEGRLRAAHLRAHLATEAVLTPEQVERYDRLRGYAGTTAPGGGATAPGGTARSVLRHGAAHEGGDGDRSVTSPGDPHRCRDEPTEQQGVSVAAPFVFTNAVAIKKASIGVPRREPRACRLAGGVDTGQLAG